MSTRQLRASRGQCVDCGLECGMYRCESCRMVHAGLEKHYRCFSETRKASANDNAKPVRTVAKMLKELAELLARPDVDDEIPDPDEPTDVPVCTNCGLRLYFTPGQIRRGETHECPVTSEIYTARKERI